jgi:hypothetical protein
VVDFGRQQSLDSRSLCSILDDVDGGWCCFHSIIFECDCSSVVDGVNELFANPITYLDNLIRGIQTHCAKFHSSLVSHIDRKANKGGHELAYLARFVPNCVWIEDIHPIIVLFCPYRPILIIFLLTLKNKKWIELDWLTWIE